jgi:hypothetical protein
MKKFIINTSGYNIPAFCLTLTMNRDIEASIRIIGIIKDRGEKKWPL